MTRAVSILDAMRDPALLGSSFPLPAWQPWVNCAAALFGLPDDLSIPDQEIHSPVPRWPVCADRPGS